MYYNIRERNTQPPSHTCRYAAHMSNMMSSRSESRFREVKILKSSQVRVLHTYMYVHL